MCTRLEIQNDQNGENYEEDETSDCDTCTEEELYSLFSTQCSLVTSKKILPDRKYILHMDATSETNPSVVISSNSSVDILEFAQSHISKTLALPLEDTIVDVKFATSDNNLVYVAQAKATISLFDVRTPKAAVKTFTDTTVNDDGEMKTLLSFDVAPDGRLLAAGSEVFDGDAFILFWDTRGAGDLLGGYWESHTDDILQVTFHADDRNRLASAGTDGLINVYNLREESEDDALTECLNTESSVELLRWCSEDIFCGTHTHDVQMWSLNDATPYGDFKRDFLSDSIKRKSDDYNYVAGCFMRGKEANLLIGSNYENGECLRGLTVKKGVLCPFFDCKENKQRVRALKFNDQTQHLFTAGEKGIVDVWHIKN